MATASHDIVSLRDLCLFTVNSWLFPSNIWSVYRLVPHVHCQKIKHTVHSFICDNFMDISHTDQFLALDENEMNWILDNQDIKVSEAAILDSLVRWYKHSQSQRENAFKRLFVKVQLSGISKDVLSVIIKKYHLDKVIPELSEYNKHLSKRVDEFERLIHQENIDNIAVLGFNTTPSTTSNDKEVCFKYWIPMASKVYACNAIVGQFDDKIEIHNVIPVQHEIFIFGLKTGSNQTDSETLVNVKLDCNTGKVTKCAQLSRRIYPYHLCIQCGIFIYLLGGSHSGIGDKSVYRYDMVNDEWEELQPMIDDHCLFTANVVASTDNRYLYVFGEDFICERYDIYTNTWILIEHFWEGFLELNENTGLSSLTILYLMLSNPSHVYLRWIASGSHVFTPDTCKAIDKNDKWCGFTLRNGFITAKSYFGQNFLLYQKPNLGSAAEIFIASKLSSLWQEEKVASMRKGVHFNSTSHITVLTRGARKELDKNKYFQRL